MNESGNEVDRPSDASKVPRAAGRRGAGLTEFGLLLGLVAVVAIGALSTTGSKVAEIFGGAANAVELGRLGLLSSEGLSLSGGVSANLPPSISTAAGSLGSVRPLASPVGLASLSASDPNGDSLSWSSSGLPAWLSLSSGGVLSIVSAPPLTGSTQVFPFSATVSDSGGLSDSRSFSVALVNSSPVVATSSLPGMVAGSAYSTTVVGTDADSDALGWSLTSGSLPAGLSRSGATVSGTPTATGPWSFELMASDGLGGTGSRTFSGSVSASIAWSGGTLASGTAGIAYSATLPAATLSGGGTLSYALGGGSTLPSGMSFSSSTRVLSGTPTASGTWSPSFDAIGSLGGSASSAFSVTIAPATLSWSGATLAGATQGQAYSATLPSASFSAGGGTLSYSATTSVPFGLSLSSGGVVSGTPNASGTASFTARATGSHGGTADATFSLTSVEALLFGGRTQASCVSAGGVVTDAGGAAICRFSASSCPSGWTKHENWSRTTATCWPDQMVWFVRLGEYGAESGWDYCSYGGCTGSHAWSNAVTETSSNVPVITVYRWNAEWSTDVASQVCSPVPVAVSSVVAEIGCR